ncbi:MAG: MFS transporter [Kiritimatiellae bacterium]|nr:MFS transporter [Kiritimatiellia bacterium]
MGKSYKWLLIGMLSCAFFFHQADRALFGLLTIPIQKEIGLTDVQIGWINTTLSWTLAAMTVVAGFLGDRFSRKWIITLSLIAWSLMTICMGFIGGFVGALFFRSIATGVGESFYAPSAYALIAVHHKETRSVALSIHQAALYVGLMVSGLMVSWALGFLGTWRNVFIAFGAAGCALGIIFIWALKDVSRGEAEARRITNSDSSDMSANALNLKTRALASASDKSEFQTLAAGLRAYFCNPSALCATAGFVAIVFVNNAYLFWAPKFAAEKFALDVGEAGKGVMLWHHLFAFGAILLGGIITDRFVKRMPRFRLGFQVLALLCGAPMLAWIGLAPSFAGLLVAASAYGVFRGFFEVNTHASLFDVVSPEHRSTAVGLLNMIAFFFGGLSGVAMGALSQKWGVRGFEIGFGVMAAAYAVGALLMAYSFFFTFRKNRVVEK